MIASISDFEEDGIGEGCKDRYLDFKSFKRAMGLEVKREEYDFSGTRRSNSF
jgi:hypothetical protein